jgi:hypothetical protein
VQTCSHSPKSLILKVFFCVFTIDNDPDSAIIRA